LFFGINGNSIRVFLGPTFFLLEAEEVSFEVIELIFYRSIIVRLAPELFNLLGNLLVLPLFHKL